MRLFVIERIEVLGCVVYADREAEALDLATAGEFVATRKQVTVRIVESEESIDSKESTTDGNQTDGTDGLPRAQAEQRGR